MPRSGGERLSAYRGDMLCLIVHAIGHGAAGNKRHGTGFIGPPCKAHSPAHASERSGAGMTTPITDIINSWRDVLPIHPAAELLPLMSADELHELAEDIKLHHQRIPVSIQEGKLLDGRNRLDAMERAGMPVVWSGALNRLVVHVEAMIAVLILMRSC